MVIFGNWKRAPSRRKGVPLKWKRTLATSAEADLDANSRASRMGSGIGILKRREASGKAGERIHARRRPWDPAAAPRRVGRPAEKRPSASRRVRRRKILQPQDNKGMTA